MSRLLRQPGAKIIMWGGDRARSHIVFDGALGLRKASFPGASSCERGKSGQCSEHIFTPHARRPCGAIHALLRLGRDVWKRPTMPASCILSLVPSDKRCSRSQRLATSSACAVLARIAAAERSSHLIQNGYGRSPSTTCAGKKDKKEGGHRRHGEGGGLGNAR